MDISEIINSDSFFLDVSNYKQFELDRISERIIEIEDNNPFWEISFCYDGAPKAAPRPRSTQYIPKGTNIKINRFYDPGSKDKKLIRDYVKTIIPEEFEPINGEILIFIKTFKPLLKKFSKLEIFLAEARILRPDKKPDVDNYAKTVMDAINGIVWVDDSRVVKLDIEKFYSVYPRIEVKLLFRNNKISNT